MPTRGAGERGHPGFALDRPCILRALVRPREEAHSGCARAEQVMMGPRVRGAGGRGKPGRIGAGAGGMLDAGHARSFHKRKSMRKGDGRYGAPGWAAKAMVQQDTWPYSCAALVFRNSCVCHSELAHWVSIAAFLLSDRSWLLYWSPRALL